MNPPSIRTVGEVCTAGTGFTIVLDGDCRAALAGLDGFSHAMVLWWAHRADSDEDRARLVCIKPYRRCEDDVGVFGSRSPSRPNPIGLSVVSIQHVDPDEGTIVVPFIDAEPGTPVIDVKPYFPASDRVREVQVPAWCRHWPQWYEDSAAFDWAAEFEAP